MQVELSRLAISGPVDGSTPRVVLKEICDCHGITWYDEYDSCDIIHSIVFTDCPSISLPIEENDYPLIGRFVNPFCTWNQEELADSFHFLFRYMEMDVPDLPNNDFTFGLQTPSEPDKINACILYRLCVVHDVILSPATTLEQMANVVSMIIKGESYSRSLLYNTIVQIPEKRKLIDLYVRLCELSGPSSKMVAVAAKSSFTFDFTDVSRATEEFKGRQSLMKRIVPATDSEAIVLAATLYKLDLSVTTNPICEYYRVVNNPILYKPEDSTLIKILEENPNYLNISYNFNPLLPIDLYTELDLKSMAKAEGFSNSDFERESPYALLQTAYLSSTFYHGRYHTIKNDNTPILYDTVTDLSPNFLICFGVKSEELIAFRYGELADFYMNEMVFLNPVSRHRENLHRIAIRKLKLLSQLINSNDTVDSMVEKRQLYNALLTVEVFNEDNLVKAKELYISYTNGDDDTKSEIRNIFSKLLNLAMFMRGWRGNEPMPIEIAIVEKADEAAVEKRVTEGIAELDTLCTTDIGGKVYDLPLLQYRGGEFMASVLDSEGQTIRDRLTIVKQGETAPTQNSCIRLSSNWLAASVYRYMEILRLPTPFQIDKLRRIS